MLSGQHNFRQLLVVNDNIEHSAGGLPVDYEDWTRDREGIQVSAGTSSAFTVASATALIAMLLFLLYDYQSGTVVKSSFPPYLET